MKIETKALIGVFLWCGIMGVSCSDDDEGAAGVYVAPGSYERVIGLNAIGGEGGEVTTRAMDEQGAFTDAYDAPSLFIHSVTDSSKYIELPILDNVEGCESCGDKGFKFHVNNYEDHFTIINPLNNDSVKFEKNEQMYLSSQASEEWVGHVVNASPITGQTVLTRDKNEEIYRSAGNYDLASLLKLNNTILTMERRVGAFRVYFMFTDLQDYDVEFDPYAPEDERTTTYTYESGGIWDDVVNLPYDGWSGKLYVGPFFADRYHLSTDMAAYDGGRTDGYYATNDQEYVPFQRVTYTRQEGTIIQNYRGYGVTTMRVDYLVTPFDRQHGGNITFYAFIKDNTNNPESDSGAKFVSYTWDELSVPAFNSTTVLVIVYDVRQLAEGFPNHAAGSSAGVNANVMKRSMWDAPERLDIQPAKVYCYSE